MNRFINSVKKIIAIILSFIFGLFHSKDKDLSDKESNNKVDELDYDKEKDKQIAANRIVQDDDFSTKSKTKIIIDSKEEIYENARKDLERIFYLRHIILKLEKKIKEVDNKEDLIEIKKQLDDALREISEIGKVYEKENTHNTVVIDIQKIYKESQEIVRENQKNIEDAIEKLEQEENNLELEEEIEEKNHSEEEIEEKEVGISHEEIRKEISTEIVEKEKVEDNTVEKVNPLENIVIKEVSEINRREENQDVEKNSKEEILSVVKKNSENENIRVYHLPKEKVEQKLKEKKNLSKKAAILMILSTIIAKVLAMTKAFTPSQMLRFSPQNTVATALVINNQIRRARSVMGKKVRKMKYKAVVQNAGLNANNQVRFLMVNTLSEIKKLKEELLQYGLDEEIRQIINKLNEMEQELVEKVSNLEFENVHTHTSSRSR